ncbi:hypothetical protein I2F27_07245 [Acinetobacter sp. B5B]|uniref:DUF6776 family protein n=1 Tax=Acinetobacter baretiae TaxID=2605383 RepID=UPI0018C318F2|nr:DUF6776 family protein [Acinetobacter baretiae]MBF7683120.1 hypothetical protein [Acinetobacter baretiae]MBF7684514.1 hypothetical protein [Acinetobacter baretiae]
MNQNKQEEPSAVAQGEGKKQNFVQASKFLLLGSVLLCFGGFAFGYIVGHKQGLTVVGYDADAQQLVDVIQKQKDTLAELNKNFNLATQERDLALSNTTTLTHTLTETQADLGISETQSQIYRNLLRQRGGVGLMVQNLAVRPLPENAFEYQLDLLQVSSGQKKASGSVELRLIRGAETLVVPMQNSRFNFENFERLTGRWTIPNGFVPQYIEVRINGGINEIRRFNWLRGKEIDHSARFATDIPQAEAKTQ